MPIVLRDLHHDLRYAVRLLGRSPGFTLVAVLSLALGIGANTAIFTLVHATMMRALPVHAPDELRLIGHRFPRGQGGRTINSGYGASVPYATYEAFRSRGDALASVFGYARLSLFTPAVNAVVDGRPGLVEADSVTGGYFAGLGVSPILGRGVVDDDVRPGAPLVAVISHGYWTSRFARDPAAVGRTIALNGVPCTIVGVAPAAFFGLEPGRRTDLWLPITDRPELAPWGNAPMARERNVFTSREWWWLTVVARVKNGVADDQARAALDAAMRESLVGYLTPAVTEADVPRTTLESGSRGIGVVRRRFATTLSILMAIVGLVLLAACANIGTLLLARATARGKEMTVRLALGASRWRLVRQLLTESLVLSLIGGVCGLLVAQWASRALIVLVSTSRSPLTIETSPDPAVLGFATIVSIATGLFFGLAPALRATRVRLAPALTERGGGQARVGGRIGFGRMLIVLQVAVSLLLLIGAGLFVRSLQKLEGEELGFDRHHVLLFGLDLGHRGAAERARGGSGSNTLPRDLLERVEALGGVRSATLVQQVLLGGVRSNSLIAVDGDSLKSGASASALWNVVGPRFCETMGIRRVLGRDIEWRDVGSAQQVAVINRTMAREFFGEANPVGRTFRMSRALTGLGERITIVGVVEDAKYTGVRERPAAAMYLSWADQASSGRLNVAVRTAGDPAALIPSVREVVRTVAPDLPLVNVRTQTDQMAESLTQERLFARLSSLFGLVALLLACIGLHGTIAYAVGRRTHEIGVRIALGARRTQVLALMLREALVLVVVGVALGVPMAIAASRLVTSQLYDVTGTDPLTLVAASTTMIATALLAAFLPARRATRIDPIRALRVD